MNIVTVPQVHNQGEPCLHCGELGRTVEANVLAPCGSVDCCAECVDDVGDGLSDFDWQRTTVEMLAGAARC